MKSIRSVLAGTFLSAAMVAAAAGYSMAGAADGNVTPAAGQTQPGPHHWRGHGGPEHFFKKLNLTAEQQASVKSLWTAARPQMQTLHQQMRANHLKLMQTKPDDPNYASVVAEVSGANATLASQRTTQMANLRQQMYAVLTPEQKTQLATLEAQRMANPQHGRWGNHTPGAAPGAETPAT